MIPQAVALWNKAAVRQRWPSVRLPTSEARQRNLARILRKWGLEGLQEALAKAEASDFLCGRVDRSAKHSNWRFTFDFFVNETNFCKVLDGNYANAESIPQPEYKSAERLLWEARLRDWGPGKKWYSHIWGPPPGEPGCLIPKAILDEYQKRLH